MKLFENSNEISNFKNPFLKDNVKSVNIDIRKTDLFHKKPIEATIYFVSGSTKGNHEITGDNLGDVIIEVQKFIDSL